MKLMMMVFAGMAMAAFARADTITLANGNTIEGKATVEGDRVKVQLGEGWVFLPKDQVKWIEKGETPLDVYAIRYGALDPKDVAGRLKLAAWCREKSLDSRNELLLNEVLALDSNDAEARRLLGYVQYQGKWVTVDERNLAMGLVEFEGKWYSPEALVELIKLRAEMESARAQPPVQLQPQYPATGYVQDGVYAPYVYRTYYVWPSSWCLVCKRPHRHGGSDCDWRDRREGHDRDQGRPSHGDGQRKDGPGPAAPAPPRVTLPPSAAPAPAPPNAPRVAPAPPPPVPRTAPGKAPPQRSEPTERGDRDGGRRR
ncbi:MAG TPA: hypothetical protein PK280_11220 [Planctomycetota bacterium]|nr:hypothetical protein [Planctomycetota bacterium]